MSDTISVYFPTTIYSLDLVLRAKADYQQICHIAVEEHDQGVVCIFSDSVVDLKLTANEFSNYLIELANSRETL